ncbi:MAG: response regulator [Verrucomicrobia bacterium]|nr:response regulator [Verrucomicrobiota bacterium]
MNILIVEDELAIRQTLQDLLELNGHTVLAAADGREGVKLAARRPDLILCDIGMPGMDGYEVIGAIQHLPQCRDIPFIFLTARADRDDQRRGMSLGADDYLTKPFSERDILDAIAARVRRLRPLRERVQEMVEQKHRQIGADWSHELLTPLNGVFGGLQLLEAEADTIAPDQLKEVLALIRAGAERQERLSRKLIRFFELERRKITPHPNGTYRCEADAAVATAAERTAQCAGREADLVVQCEAAIVPLSEAYLADAVGELIENAFHFSAPGQPVAVSGRRVDGTYRIEVTDEGAGMTAEERAGVAAFTQFGRGTRDQQGLGLGLAIARSTAGNAGGKLILEPGPNGRGIKAVIELPSG